MPLYDALDDALEPGRVRELMEDGIIEIAPLAYMRGRTLNDSFIILDEAQNSTKEQMKMFLALSAGQFIAGAQEGVVADLSEREKYAEKLAELFSEALKNPDSESAQFWGPLVAAVKELSLEELDAPFSPEEYIRGMAVISAVEKGNFKPLQDKENAKTIIRGLVRTGNREITELYYAFHADELRQKVRQSIGKGMKM